MATVERSRFTVKAVLNSVERKLTTGFCQVRCSCLLTAHSADARPEQKAHVERVNNTFQRATLYAVYEVGDAPFFDFDLGPRASHVVPGRDFWIPSIKVVTEDGRVRFEENIAWSEVSLSIGICRESPTFPLLTPQRP